MRAGFFLALLMCAQTAAAQEAQSRFGALQQTFELPAHRGLMDKIESVGGALAPFTTDGCSGGLSSTWSVVADIFPGFAEAHEGLPPWEDCCVAHDRQYHHAGAASTPESSFGARLEADETLRACVVSGGAARLSDLATRYEVTEDQVRLAYNAIGDAMFNAVRFGGAPCSGLSWRWGYGYPNCFPALN
jgi:hypothetical protein